MNPEFRRQLWLQFSVTRVGTMVLLLAACFTAVYLSSPAPTSLSLATTGFVLYGLLVLGMGTAAAGASVMDEVADKTWDQQRMSAMQPWTMAWGKLAGASAFSWLGGALCLLVAIPNAIGNEPADLVGKFVLAAILAGILVHALLYTANLQLVKSGRRIAPRGGLLLALFATLMSVGPLLSSLRGPDVLWWGHILARMDFVLVSLALFTACALLAAWRTTAEVLAVRQMPWAWPSMALVFAVYLTGFASTDRGGTFIWMTLVNSVVLTYSAMLLDPQSRPQWARVLNRLQHSQWRAACLQMPPWPTTVLLALLCTLCLLVMDRPLISTPWAQGQTAWLQPITVVLLMLRDSALALCLSFSLSVRRPVMAFVLLMLVLYGLLPWLTSVAAGSNVLALVLPLVVHTAFGPVIAAAHVLLAGGLLVWRWRTTAA